MMSTGPGSDAGVDTWIFDSETIVTLAASLAPKRTVHEVLPGWKPLPSSITFSLPLTVPTAGSTELTLSSPLPDEQAQTAAHSPNIVAIRRIIGPSSWAEHSIRCRSWHWISLSLGALP